jgi:hypothetical protein
MRRSDEVLKPPKKDPPFIQAFDAVFEALGPLSPLERLEIVAEMAALVDIDLNHPGPIDSTIAIVAALVRQASERMRPQPAGVGSPASAAEAPTGRQAH